VNTASFYVGSMMGCDDKRFHTIGSGLYIILKKTIWGGFW
jgi:hypothetical protein